MTLQTEHPVDTSPIDVAGDAPTDLDPLWRAVEPEMRTRGNDIHIPISFAFAERLCEAYPEADSLVVRVAILLHDTGWARVDETKIISEGFGANWRQAQIRFEHEIRGCEIAREVLPGLGYDDAFITRVTDIIDGHDTRAESHSIEDSLVRDADRLWRFNPAGIALASSWFGQTPSFYCRRLRTEILPELITAAGLEMATVELDRAEALLKVAVL
ncbi:HD domain-containing protein [Cryobacterium sp. HLT2-28]|uniref:HD domain-containing protein n=1 Tax=Cryobacterium sp. HLT2-28 TaxID=1259146 RepID=UPI0010699B18|nr:HD domain-containing protein [Cryobacterium sp. HLT2-28]TFB91377.1 HD domain-containing protein [Cryobacterium sp. HLT2-28]